MEDIVRKPFQGVLNIIRFNWHFYVIAFVTVSSLLFLTYFLPPTFAWACVAIAAGIILSTTISLAVSFYVYDYSSLYRFDWIKLLDQKATRIVNVNAGFDETSLFLTKHFPAAHLNVFDFYDPKRHTEVSIERARKAYASYPGTVQINTTGMPVASQSVDLIFNIFALHEIRNTAERNEFLKLQASALTPNGRCIVVEHLRDTPNFLAYNIGFVHFFSQAEWKSNFASAGLAIHDSFKITPFVSIFILTVVHGNTP